MRAGTAIASGTRHIVGVALQASLIVAIVAGLAFAGATVAGSAPGGAQSVFAAKGGGGRGVAVPAISSISLDQAGQTLSLGSSVTFTTTVGDLTGTERALVYLKCVEGDTVVYGQLDLPGTTFVLGGGSSPWWQAGGTATCVGYLDAYGTHGGSDTIRVLAETAPFSAN